MAPNPMRLTRRSPPMATVPAAAAGSSVTTRSRRAFYPVGPDHDRDAAEHAVDEPARLLGRVGLGQFDGLADHRAGRDIRALQQLPGGLAQERPADRRHAVDSPGDGVRPDQRVDLRHAPPDARHLCGRERVGSDRELVEQLGGGDALHLGLVQQAEGALAGLPAWSHTRVRYSPVRVSTLTRSPVLTKSGTEMT